MIKTLRGVLAIEDFGLKPTKDWSFKLESLKIFHQLSSMAMGVFNPALLTFALREELRAPGSVSLAISVDPAGQLVAGLAGVGDATAECLTFSLQNTSRDLLGGTTGDGCGGNINGFYSQRSLVMSYVCRWGLVRTTGLRCCRGNTWRERSPPRGSPGSRCTSARSPAGTAQPHSDHCGPRAVLGGERNSTLNITLLAARNTGLDWGNTRVLSMFGGTEWNIIDLEP